MGEEGESSVRYLTGASGFTALRQSIWRRRGKIDGHRRIPRCHRVFVRATDEGIGGVKVALIGGWNASVAVSLVTVAFIHVPNMHRLEKGQEQTL